MPLRFNRGRGLDLSDVGKSRLNIKGVSAPEAPMDFAKSDSSKTRNKTQTIQQDVRDRQARRNSRIRILRIVILVVAALALALGVGVFVYQQTVRVGLKSDLDTETLNTVLTVREDKTEPYWILLNSTDAESSEYGRGTMQALSLVYIDPAEVTGTYIEIPSDTRLYLDGYGYQTLAEIFAYGSEGDLIGDVEDLFGVKVAHYAEANKAGMNALLNNLNLRDIEGDDTDLEPAVMAFVERVTSFSSEQIERQSENALSCVASDMDAEVLDSVVSDLQGMDVEKDFHFTTMPHSSGSSDSGTYSDPKRENIATVVGRLESGKTPEATKKELSDFESIRASTEVTIWNGVGVSGIAADCAEQLSELGWKIESTGNAASYVYDETLVVYQDNEDEEVAELLIDDLKQGRAIRSAARYSFEGDILVVLGQDYHPY